MPSGLKMVYYEKLINELFLQRDKKMVLSGVTGCINCGEVTAVMGPSGAGKTTFLNALSGKAYYGVS